MLTGQSDSRNMAAIRSEDTGPEMGVRKIAHRLVEWRQQQQTRSGEIEDPCVEPWMVCDAKNRHADRIVDQEPRLMA
jgi:G:T-mismatch repair DNA endonuclease (very short patch repair protein)